MKNAAFFFATAATFSFLLLGNTLSAQAKSTWKGGTPGRAHEWNCAANWLENRVPNEFSNVVVPNVSSTTAAAPVISAGDFEVNAIWVAADAHIFIERSASLTVLSTANGIDPTFVKGKLILPTKAAKKNEATAVVASNFPDEK
jgi:hypothetical protein